MLKHLGIITKIRSKPREHRHRALSGNSGQGSKTRLGAETSWCTAIAVAVGTNPVFSQTQESPIFSPTQESCVFSLTQESRDFWQQIILQSGCTPLCPPSPEWEPLCPQALASVWWRQCPPSRRVVLFSSALPWGLHCGVCSYAYLPTVCLLWWAVCQGLDHSFTRLFIFLFSTLRTFIRYVFYKHFLCVRVFLRARVVHSTDVQFVNCLVLGSCLWCHI